MTLSIKHPSIWLGVMLRRYVIVLLGMNPRLNRSTSPEIPYLLGLMMTTLRVFARDMAK
jgi:hypothetical protein